MKKSIILFLFSLLILNIFIISLNAQTTTLPGNIDPGTDPQEKLEKFKDIGESLTDEEQRSEYLKKEWERILEKSKFFGPIIRGYEKTTPFTDPIFKYTVGLPSSLSWLFILALIIYIFFIIYIFRILEFVSIVSKPTQHLIFIGSIVVISLTAIARRTAEAIIKALSVFTIWWVQLMSAVAIILILMFLGYASKSIREYFEGVKEKKDEEDEEMLVKELEKNVKVSKILADAATSPKKDYEDGFVA